MHGPGLTCYSFWWIVPIVMMFLCFFMMRGRRRYRMCGFGPRSFDNNQTNGQDSAIKILDRRYASGEIDKTEYEEKKRTLTESAD
jgi:uncharacterized membrane protein